MVLEVPLTEAVQNDPLKRTVPVILGVNAL